MYEYESKNFSKQLATLISDSDKTIEEIARQIGVQDTTLYRYVNKNNIPGLSLFLKIADYFHCTSNFLLGIENDYFEYTYRPYLPFSDRFKQIMIEKNDNVNKISKQTGIPDANLYAWKNGVNLPSVDYAVAIANYFKLSLDDFLGR